MIAKTTLMPLLLLGAAVIAAYGVWFGLKAHQGWKDSRSDDEHGEPGWLILGVLGGAARLIALIKLGHELAISN